MSERKRKRKEREGTGWVKEEKGVKERNEREEREC